MKNIIMKLFDDAGKLRAMKKATVQFTWGEYKQANRVFEISLGDGWIIDLPIQTLIEEFMRK